MRGAGYLLSLAFRGAKRDRLAGAIIAASAACAVFVLIFGGFWPPDSRELNIRIVAGKELEDRGILLSDSIYEGELKHPAARVLDEARRIMLEDEKPPSIQLAARLDHEAIQLARALDLEAAQRIEEQLIAADPTLAGADLEQVLSRFFSVDPATVGERHRMFYRFIAPHLVLYDVPIGGLIAMSYVSSSGARGTLRLPLAGTFRIAGESRSTPRREALIDPRTLIEIDPLRGNNPRPVPVLWTQTAAAGMAAIGVTTSAPKYPVEKPRLHRWLALGSAALLMLLAVFGGGAAIRRSPDRAAQAAALRTIGASPRFIAGRLIAEVSMLVLLGGAIGGGSAWALIHGLSHDSAQSGTVAP